MNESMASEERVELQENGNLTKPRLRNREAPPDWP
jgi:hypothetical protein